MRAWYALGAALALAKLALSVGPVPQPPFWWEGTSWKGEMRFQSRFADANMALASPRPEFECAPTEMVNGGIGLYVGTFEESFMNFTAGNVSAGPGFSNPIPMEGRVLYTAGNGILAPVRVDSEEFMALEVSSITAGRKLMRQFPTAYLKLGRTTFAGNHEQMRIVESFTVASGVISSYPSLRRAYQVQCTANERTTVVTTLVPDEWRWHASPWGECGGTGLPCNGTRSRTVECRDTFGGVGDATRCAGAAPENSTACAAAACSTTLVSEGFAPGEGKADGVLVPGSLAGNWTMALQTFDGPGGAPLPSSDKVVRVMDVAITAGSNASAPSLTVARDNGALFRYDPDAQNATALGLTASAAVFPSASSRVFATGNGTSGRIDFGAAGVGTASIAYMQSSRAVNAGGCLSTAVHDAATSLAVAVTPELPSAGPAFGVNGRAASGLSTGMPDAAARRAEPNSSILVGTAVPGPATYTVSAFGGCGYYADANACQRRRPPLACRDRNGAAVASAFCAGLTPPADTGPDVLPCSGCLRYDVGPWSPCSKVCESGVSSRSVRCVGGSNETRNMADCVALLGRQPEQSRACNAFACSAYYVGPWSGCSSPCGPATKSRRVWCADIDGELPESRCVAENRTRPIDSESCYLCPCEDPSLVIAATVQKPLRPSEPGGEAALSTAGSAVVTTSRTFCDGDARLLRESEFRCYPAAAQARMCATLNAASGDDIIPLVLRAEAGANLSVPVHVPPLAEGSPSPDTVLVRPDPQCFFNQYSTTPVAFVDKTRQAAVGLCRQIRI